MSNPDFTKGESVPDGATQDYHFGATGITGWMYSERMVTRKARQIYVLKVDQGSPAEGVIQQGDVILGVSGERFSYDPRTEMGKALTEAEQIGGRLSLIRWRDNEVQTVAVRLPAMGSYSPTAPYRCAKSRRIFEQGCEALAEDMQQPGYRRNPTERSLNALALLASGEQKYRALIEREVQWAADFSTESFSTWWYGYTMMLLAEYTMATGDTSYLPGLERQAIKASEGQSIVGSWGHRYAGEDGRLLGYGMMNAPGLTLTIGLALAREAGIDDPRLSEAIDRSTKLLRFYVGKGSIPYGDHHPWTQTHDDNGKNSAAAVLFHLLGEKDSAEYFAQMALACHGNERDTGHTGNFWNMLWALPGVAQAGPHASGAWMQEFGQWYFDSARTWDGRFVHLGPPQMKADKYPRWDCTGAYLLAYARPLKLLRLTGRGEPTVTQLTLAQAEAIVAAGRGWNNLDRNSYLEVKSDEQLLGLLGSWSPVLRERAAQTLGRRKADVLPQVLAMLGSTNLHKQYGACQAIGLMRGDREEAVEPLRQLLNADDLWLRISAGQALAGIGKPALVAVPDMLDQLAKPSGDDDPRGMEQRYLCFSLFNNRGGLISRSLQGVDPELLYEAVRKGLANQDGRARGAIASIYRYLSYEEIKPILPAIRRAVVEPAPSGIMFASQIRTEGLRVLARHHIEEGMQDGVDLLDQTWDKWGKNGRTPAILDALVLYGAHAQRIVPQLEAIADQHAEQNARTRSNELEKYEIMIRKTIDKIKASKDKPDLRRLPQERVGQR